MFILEPDARRAAGRHKQEPRTRCSGRAARTGWLAEMPKQIVASARMLEAHKNDSQEPTARTATRTAATARLSNPNDKMNPIRKRDLPTWAKSANARELDLLAVLRR